MKNIYWLSRWENSDIHFHLDQPHPLLLKHYPTQIRPNSKVFVPFCGKSLDMIELHSQGHFVIGSELSEIAIKSFFTENNIDYTQQQSGEHQYWSSDRLTLIQGDYFSLRENAIMAQYAYDRAALVALPPDMQQNYINQLVRIAPNIEKIMLITFQYDESINLPPFSIPPERVRELYHEYFDTDLIETRQTKASPTLQKHGLSVISEHVFILNRK